MHEASDTMEGETDMKGLWHEKSVVKDLWCEGSVVKLGMVSNVRGLWCEGSVMEELLGWDGGIPLSHKVSDAILNWYREILTGSFLA